ncbi:MAG: hypothetical protein OXG66_06205 [Acidimicrobiaceae bacterium]|nr:hypothetical protein [Acidimicrobiaceae bacterium]
MNRVVGAQLWSIVWGPFDTEGERVNYRADRLAQMLHWCALVLHAVVIYTIFWDLLMPWRWWVVAMLAVDVPARVRLWLVVRAAGPEPVLARVSPVPRSRRWWLWLADKADQDADESLAKAEKAKDTLAVATKLHRARKSREAAEQYRQRALGQR